MTIHVDPPILPMKDEPMVPIPLDLLQRAIKLLDGDGIALVTHEQKVAHYIAESDAARDLRAYLPDY